MIPSPDNQCTAGASAAIDCWNSVGVHGDSSCPQLRQHVHCRNCPLYTTAAARFLDTEPPADYLAHWTQQAEQPGAQAQADMQSVVIFCVGSEWLALPTRVLDEIADLRAVHAIPHRRGGMVMGLVNIRGELLVCVSLQRILGLEASPPATLGQRHAVAARLLVLQRDGGRIVCPVDQVRGIEHYRPQDLLAPPATVANAVAAYTRALLIWQDQPVGLLDDQRLLENIARGLA